MTAHLPPETITLPGEPNGHTFGRITDAQVEPGARVYIASCPGRNFSAWASGRGRVSWVKLHRGTTRVQSFGVRMDGFGYMTCFMATDVVYLIMAAPRIAPGPIERQRRVACGMPDASCGARGGTAHCGGCRS